MSSIIPVNIPIGGPMVLISESDAPSTEAAAQGSSALDSRQRAIVIGEPVPIVFGKRVSRTTYKWNGDVGTAVVYDVGGVFVSPGATEGRFSNNASTNELAVKFHLVLSQGDMPQLQLRDVFQRACRVGTWKQTYDRRAGTWTPGNFITAVAGKQLWDCPIFCGTSGYYDDLTTLSYENSHSDGDDTWDRQVHCLVRDGIIVDRLIEGTTGSSNNVCDLAVYLIKQSSRFPDALIDTATFTTAANFTETQQLYYNGEFRDSQNLEDWLQDISTYFLLRVSDKNGKKAFRPRLPITGAYAIDIGVVASEFGFTEDHLLPDGFEIEWIPFADRRPTIMQMVWRQQPDDDIGLIRTSLVNIVDAFTDQPTEQHDLSQFCSSELHAVKVGAYLAARRAFVTHTLRIRVKPDAYNTTLALGDIVRVRLRRETNLDAVTWHDYLYEVERINKTLSGAVELDLIHFPIDSNGRSVVALYVQAASVKGYVYDTGRSDFTCDIPGRDTDDDPIPDEGGTPGGLPPTDTDETPVDPDLPTWPPDVPDPTWPDGTADPDDPNNQAGREGQPVGGISNPADPFDSDPAPTVTDNRQESTDPLVPGNELTASTTCTGGITSWYKVNQTTGEATLIAENQAVYTLQGSDIGFTVYAETCCPDPGAPSGFGGCTKSAQTEVVGNTGAWVSGAGSWRIRRFTSPFNQAVYTFTTVGSGFSIWMSQADGCPPSAGRVHLSYFAPDGSFFYDDDIFGMACETIGDGQFLANLDKLIDGVYVFQYALYS